MANAVLLTEETSDTPTQDLVTDEQVVDQVVAIWDSHHGNDLEARFKTGRLLNAAFGDPAVRQSYRKGVLKTLSDRAKISTSDISRFRRFATLGGSVDEIQEKYPEVTCWTKAKELIDRQNPSRKARAQTDSKMPAGSAALGGALSHLDRFVERLGKGDVALTDADRSVALDSLRQFAGAVHDHLGITIQILES